MPYPDTYLPLHLLFDRDTVSGQYYARIVPPAPAAFVFPDGLYRLELTRSVAGEAKALADALEPAITGSADRGESSAAFKAITRHGQWIDDLLPKTRAFQICLQNCLSVNRINKSVGLLIRLHFGEQAQELSKLFWETWCLSDESDTAFLIRRSSVALARFVPTAGDRRGSGIEKKDSLKIVMASVRYDTHGDPDPQIVRAIEEDRRSLEGAVADLRAKGVVELVNLRDPTLDELQQALCDADIYHHYGHGAVDAEGAPYLVLKDPDGERGQNVYWHNLSTVFGTDSAPNLQLAVLNACELQQTGLGARLARLGIPAVIAMQAEISMEVIAVKGFTRDFYLKLAAGWPVHKAFSYARSRIWTQNNCVEPFVPVLILSALDDVVFQHSRQTEAREVAQAAEAREDPAKARWEAACRLEEQQKWDEAERAFTALAAIFPGYPGLPEGPNVDHHLRDLRAKRDRQQRLEQVVANLREAAALHDVERVTGGLHDAAPFLDESLLKNNLEATANTLAADLARQQTENRWLEARQICQTLRALAAAYPPAGEKANEQCAAIEAKTSQALGQRRNDMQQLFRKGDWQRLSDEATAYLALDPENRTVRDWLAKAQDVLEVLGQVRVMDQRETRAATAQVATAQAALKRRDWAAAKQAARELLRRQPRDPKGLQWLAEALAGEAEAFRNEGRWDEAKADCRERLQLPDQAAENREAAWTQLGQILRGTMEDALRRGDWPAVQRLCGEVLAEPNLKPLHPQAEAWKGEAEDAVRLLKRIKLL